MGKGRKGPCACCAKVPGCGTFCNLTNGIGCISQDDTEQRERWCRIKQIFCLIATVFGIVGAFGLSADASIMKNTSWMKYEADSAFLAAANFNFSSLEIYGNIWGIAFFCDGGTCPAHASNLVQSNSTLDWTKPTSWDDASATAGSDFNNGCKDAATSFKIIVIAMGVIGNFANTVNAMNRVDPANDYYEKCLGILGSIIPVVTNLSVIAAFPEKCNVSGAHYTSSLGPGYICFLLAVILGNIPALFIELAIRAPPPDEFEAKEQDGMEVGDMPPGASSGNV